MLTFFGAAVWTAMSSCVVRGLSLCEWGIAAKFFSVSSWS